MAVRAALAQLEQFFSGKHAAQKFQPCVETIRAQMKPQEMEVIHFINRRIEEEQFINQQMQNQQALENFYMHVEDAYGSFMRQVIKEKIYLRMKRAEIELSRQNTLKKIMEQKQQCINDMIDRLQQQKDAEILQKTVELEREQKEISRQKSMIIQEHLKLDGQMIKTVLMMSAKRAQGGGEEKEQEKHVLSRRITMPVVRDDDVDRGIVEAINNCINYSIVQGVNQAQDGENGQGTQ